jgi:DNA-binding transcriptional ArsR family regulator
MNEAQKAVLEGIKRGDAFRGLPQVEISEWRAGKNGFDAGFRLQSRGAEVKVYVEVKASCSPKTILEIAPWIRRIKRMNPGTAVALACPVMTVRAQQVCLENDIDFLDLAGNVYINTGDFLLQRTGRDAGRRRPGTRGQAFGNPFSPRSSRVVRVLLEKPGTWRLTAIADELEREGRENPISRDLSFKIDLSSISRALSALTEELLVRKRGQDIIVSDPGRLLAAWAEKYQTRFRRMLRDSIVLRTSSEKGLADLAIELGRASRNFVFTSATAASVTAPYVDVDVVDAFAMRPEDFLASGITGIPTARTPLSSQIRITRAYDAGVFMYARIVDGIPVTSPVQAYLDLYARGGRDRKQADFLLEQVLRPKWKT